MRMSVILYIVLISLTAFGRVAYVVHYRTFEQIRPNSEMELAAASLAQNGFIGQTYNNSPSDSSAKSAHVAPLYVLLLAGLYWIFGWNTSAGRLAQEVCAIIATILGIALLPVIARKAHLAVAAGWIAAYALAILPINLWVETSGNWEQPYSALVLLGLFVVFCRLKDEQWQNNRTILLAGILLGIIALLSPSLLPAGVLMIIAELVARRSNQKRIVAASVVMVCSAGLVVAPWIVRNYYALGGFVPIRSNFGLELAIGNNPEANGTSLGTTLKDKGNLFDRYHPSANAKELTRLLEMGELAYMRDKQQAALQWIKEHPGKAIELITHRFRFYWFPPKDMWDQSSPGRRLKAAIMSIIGFTTLVSIIYLISNGHDRAWLLAAAVIGPSLTYMITHVDMRYRYPISGISTLLALHLFLLAWPYTNIDTGGESLGNIRQRGVNSHRNF
jgi:hypothetical protein